MGIYRISSNTMTISLNPSAMTHWYLWVGGTLTCFALASLPMLDQCRPPLPRSDDRITSIDYQIIADVA